MYRLFRRKIPPGNKLTINLKFVPLKGLTNSQLKTWLIYMSAETHYKHSVMQSDEN